MPLAARAKAGADGRGTAAAEAEADETVGAGDREIIVGGEVAADGDIENGHDEAG